MPTDNDGNSGSTPIKVKPPVKAPVKPPVVHHAPAPAAPAVDPATQRKAWYDAADAANGWPAGTAAANNGEAGIAGSPIPAAAPAAAPAAPAAPASDPTTPAPTSATAATVKTFDTSLYQAMASYLQQYGLGSLFQTGADGSPSGWLYDQMKNGVDTADEIQIAVESTQQWKDRFDVIVKQREQAAAGNPVQVMTPAQVRQYEETASSLMRNAGLPQWMYDGPKDFESLMLAGVSTAEVQSRLGTAFDRVKNTTPAIRDAFEEFYGVGQGDAALASYFLDPGKTMANLDRASREAFTAGTAKRYGMTIGQGLASDITDKSLTDAGIDQGFENINRLSSVFQENALETQDLSAEKEGVQSVFDGNGIAQDSIERRIKERQANSSTSTGGALVTQAGAIGAGRIDR